MEHDVMEPTIRGFGTFSMVFIYIFFFAWLPPYKHNQGFILLFQTQNCLFVLLFQESEPFPAEKTQGIPKIPRWKNMAIFHMAFRHVFVKRCQKISFFLFMLTILRTILPTVPPRNPSSTHRQHTTSPVDSRSSSAGVQSSHPLTGKWHVNTKESYPR